MYMFLYIHYIHSMVYMYIANMQYYNVGSYGNQWTKNSFIEWLG